MTSSYLLLVDGNNLAMRIIKALEHSSGGSMTSEGGDNTGPVHVFAQAMMRYINGFVPDSVVICFDGSRNARRMSLHPGYKASRRSRSPIEEQVHQDRFRLIKEWATLYGCFCIQRDDLEADDLISIYARFSEPNVQIQIVTADRDMHQLVSDRVHVLSPGQGGQGKDVLWWRKEVREKYGCEPEQLSYLKALMGDVSDDINGIPGIGPKRALKICSECEFDFERILAHPLVKDHKNLVERNLELMDLSRVPQFDIQDPPRFQRMELASSSWKAMQEFCRQHDLAKVEKTMEDSMVGWNRGK